jgi:hypothetical protein
MRKTTIVGLCAAAVLGICAVTSAPALALPEPELLHKGVAITKVPLTVKSGFGKIETSLITLTWQAATAEGELEKPNKLAKFVLRFTGDKIGSCEVNSPGAKKGEVVTKELHGVFKYVNETGPVVGVLVQPSTGNFGEIETSLCASAFELTGSVIGSVGPINHETTGFEAIFGIVGKKQQYKKFVGEATEHFLKVGEVGLEGAFECTEGITTNEAVELKT